MRREAYNDIGALGWFIAGIAVGGGAALLFAPSSGREMRAKLHDEMEAGKAKVQETAQQMKDRARHAAAGVAHRAGDMIDAGKDIYQETVQGRV